MSGPQCSVLLAARSQSLISGSGNSQLLFNVEIRNMGTDTVYVNVWIYGNLTHMSSFGAGASSACRRAYLRWRSLPVRTFLSAEWAKLTARGESNPHLHSLKSLNERWQAIERVHGVGGPGAAGTVVKATVSRPAQPHSPNAERLAARNVGI